MEAERVCCEDEGCCRCKSCKTDMRMRGRKDEGKGEPRRATEEQRHSSEN